MLSNQIIGEGKQLKSETWKDQTVSRQLKQKPQTMLKDSYRNTKASSTQQGQSHVWHPIKNYQACEEAGKHYPQWGEKSANWNWPRMTKMLELVDKSIKKVITIVFHMFKNLEEKLNMLSRDIEYIYISYTYILYTYTYIWYVYICIWYHVWYICVYIIYMYMVYMWYHKIKIFQFPDKFPLNFLIKLKVGTYIIYIYIVYIIYKCQAKFLDMKTWLRCKIY